MSEIIQKNNQYLVKSQYGSYKFNNKQSAEQLNTTLNQYEQIIKNNHETEKTLDQVQKNVIQLQMSLSILQNKLNQLKEDLKCLN